MVNGTSRSRRSSRSTSPVPSKKRKRKLASHLSKFVFVSFFGIAGVTGLNLKKTVNIQIDAVQMHVSTSAATVDQLLVEENIDKTKYKVITNDDKITDGETIMLSAEKKITLTVGGEAKEVSTKALTVDEFFAEQQIVENDTNQVVAPQSLNKSDLLVRYSEIKVDVVTTSQKEVELKSHLPVTVEETDLLPSGTVETVPGEERVVVETYDVKLVNGVETSSTKTGELVVKEGKPEVKRIGTGSTLSSGTMTEDKESAMRDAGISESDFEYVNYIVERESRWNYTAMNSTTGAYGLPQALPGTKMESAGSDWKTNPVTQLKWADQYAKSRYGSWENAYHFWLQNHWW